MQIAETLNEGLKRAFTLTIAAADIDALVDAEVKKVAPQMKMPGFRPGKVPANLVRKMHGPALQQEALSTAIQNGVSKLVTDNALRPAMQPSVALNDNYEPGKDAEVTVALEILPDVPAPAIDGLKLERLTVEPADEAVDAQLQQLVSQQKSFDDAAEGHAAAMGDLVVMDFLGKVDGEPFDGGKGEGMSIELGSGRLIPGFEDGLVGVKVGEARTVEVTFPEDYNVAYLKGKPATFDITVTALKTAKAIAPDDDFAKSLGLEGIDQLRGLLKGQIEQELNGLTRTHMKRKLLDQLADAHDFPVPPSMVDAEFEQIWQQLEHEAGHEADPEAARAEMEGDREDYRRIAERRVRLGLLLSEIGQANGVDITQAEMQRLIAQAAQQYDPKERERFVQYIQAEPMAAAQLRAPLYEDKVVDFLFSKADITDRTATREELEAAIEAEEGSDVKPHVHGPDCGHDHEPAAKPKKAKKAKEAAPEAAPEPVAEGPVEAEAPAKPKRAAKTAAAVAVGAAVAVAAGAAAVVAATEEAPAAAKPKRAPAKKKAAD